ncbi:MAG TPA: glutaredoxin domain-containing protein [Candidatus Saccharimonadales bacterium]|nr:glutaredoxin domain-containing protein [Candidatus Saccharimonadales bacterium]
MAKVTIYTTPTCGFCHMEKVWLKDKKVDFTEKDITTDVDAYHEAIQKANQPVVPITDIDGDIIIGFDRPKIESRLKEVGAL